LDEGDTEGSRGYDTETAVENGIEDGDEIFGEGSGFRGVTDIFKKSFVALLLVCSGCDFLQCLRDLWGSHHDIQIWFRSSNGFRWKVEIVLMRLKIIAGRASSEFRQHTLAVSLVDPWRS
jgi:hypothetical protein